MTHSIMVHVQLDMKDPDNPIAKVRRVEIAFTAQYRGDDAWNQDILVPKLEKYLWDNGFSLTSYNLTHSWDQDNNTITEDEMKNYIYKIHGHTGSKCSSCPDPIKWKAVERLRMKEFLAQKEVLDDKRQGRQHGYNWATGEFMKNKKEIVYILETQEERNIRLNPEKDTNKNGKKPNGTTKRPTTKNT